MKEPSGELRELKHEPKPGYKTAFYVAFAIGVAYLVLIFLLSF